MGQVKNGIELQRRNPGGALGSVRGTPLHDQIAGEDLHGLVILVDGRGAHLHDALVRARFRSPHFKDLALDS
ncbi:hypothetical protein D3C72_2501570 [compost metagenome]